MQQTSHGQSEQGPGLERPRKKSLPAQHSGTPRGILQRWNQSTTCTGQHCTYKYQPQPDDQRHHPLVLAAARELSTYTDEASYLNGIRLMEKCIMLRFEIDLNSLFAKVGTSATPYLLQLRDSWENAAIASGSHARPDYAFGQRRKPCLLQGSRSYV